MSTFESSVREIAHAQQSVYNALSDLSNLERLRDRIPQDKINDFSFDADHISFQAPMVGIIRLAIVDREAPKTIKFETEQSPIPFHFWIQLLPLTDTSCKMKLTLKADINPFIKGMVQKPLQEGINKIADVLQMINYD